MARHPSPLFKILSCAFLCACLRRTSGQLGPVFGIPQRGIGYGSVATGYSQSQHTSVGTQQPYYPASPLYTPGYGYGYANTQLRNTPAQQETMDMAQKPVIFPMSNVMVSPLKSAQKSVLSNGLEQASGKSLGYPSGYIPTSAYSYGYGNYPLRNAAAQDVLDNAQKPVLIPVSNVMTSPVNGAQKSVVQSDQQQAIGKSLGYSGYIPTYGYTNNQLRNTAAREEALDNAQKPILIPMSNVMVSAPVAINNAQKSVAPNGQLEANGRDVAYVPMNSMYKSGYSNGHSTNQLRNAATHEEAIDLAQKLAMIPMSNVMVSPPMGLNSAPKSIATGKSVENNAVYSPPCEHCPMYKAWRTLATNEQPTIASTTTTERPTTQTPSREQAYPQYATCQCSHSSPNTPLTYEPYTNYRSPYDYSYMPYYFHDVPNDQTSRNAAYSWYQPTFTYPTQNSPSVAMYNRYFNGKYV